MKILVVHQYFLMPGRAGGSRFNEFARLWREAGHEVEVIAGNLDYTSGEIPEEYRHLWARRCEEDGQAVWRCHVPSSYSKSYAGRAWAFLGFTLSASTAALRCARPDVVIATSPPLVAVVPGWIAAKVRLRPVPWVFEIRDLWPESAVTTGVLSARSPLTKALYALERWAAKAADRINVLTPAFQDDLVARGLAPRDKIWFVPNGADLDLFSPGPRDNAFRREQGWGDKFVVMYTGAHGRANALGQLLDAAELLRDRDDIHFAFVGDGPERKRLEEDAQARGLTNVTFCGPQPKARMPEVIRACDVGAAVLQRNPTFKTVYPNKVFDYMACERPVLLAIDGVARTLVCDEAKAGVFVEPENSLEISLIVRQFAAEPERRRVSAVSGRDWVLRTASRRAFAAVYLDRLRPLALAH
ncbi:MAG: glycosyltransferase family 4 protein [Polyangiaceae bacterium]|nr:glycosyltransferase family 4 protein [Polyangiaceae bacterium]